MYKYCYFKNYFAFLLIFFLLFSVESVDIRDDGIFMKVLRDADNSSVSGSAEDSVVLSDGQTDSGCNSENDIPSSGVVSDCSDVGDIITPVRVVSSFKKKHRRNHSIMDPIMEDTGAAAFVEPN